MASPPLHPWVRRGIIQGSGVVENRFLPEGLTKDVKKHAYYEKPSERRRRAMRKSQKRMVRGGR